MDFNAKLITADTSVKIGKSNQATNKVKITVTTSPQQAQTKVTVTVGCGPTEDALLASQDEVVKVTCQAAGETEAAEMTAAPKPPTGKKAWDTGDFPISLPLLITLENFVSNTPPGDAVITVLVEKSKGGNDWEKGESFSIEVKKELEPRDRPEIRYFTVNPNYILHAGQTEVTASFCATGYETLTLFRNNEEMRNWPEAPDAANKIIFGAFPVKGKFPETEKPSITSVYRLKGKYKKQGDKEKEKGQTEVEDTLDRTVQVISPGWNQIELPQGSPVRLFVADDFSGSGSKRSYGIFKDRGGAYALYSSATGVDAWRLEPGDVPPEMATSPGVYYKNKLWLIGGSSVDPNNPRNQVRCYEKADPNRVDRSWNKKNDFPSTMPGRMGHACVVFQDTLWVIGGYNNGKAYRDVWQGKEKADGQLEWSCLQDQCDWDGRLYPAATTWRNPEGLPEVWIYGGSADPQSSEPMHDFWSTRDGRAWQRMDEKGSPPVPIMPDPGAPLASTLVAFPQKEASTTAPQTEASTTALLDRLFLMGSFKEFAIKEKDLKPGNRIFSFLFEWHPGTGLWEGRPVFDGWQQFQGQNFYMQAVVFNRFLFCWSLRDDPTFIGKLNILVSR